MAQCRPCNDPNFPVPDGIIDYNAAAISIISGGQIEFGFLNIQNYRNGVTITNGTILGITVCDCASEFGADPVANSSITGWELYFDTDDASIQGTSAANTLPLCLIEAEASTRIGMAGVVYNGRQPLNTQGLPPTPIAQEAAAPPSRDWNTDQVNITYYCAVPPTNADCVGAGQIFPLIDDPVIPDYYTVSASFTLVPICAACADPFY